MGSATAYNHTIVRQVMNSIVTNKVVTALGNKDTGRMFVNRSNMMDIIVGNGIKFIFIL